MLGVVTKDCKSAALPLSVRAVADPPTVTPLPDVADKVADAGVLSVKVSVPVPLMDKLPMLRLEAALALM